VRAAIAAALVAALAGHPEERPALAALLDRAAREDEVSPVAQALIGAFGDAALPDLLARAADDRRPAEARGAILVALAAEPTSSPELVDTLLVALRDPAAEVRHGSVLALVNRSTAPRRAECVSALLGLVGSDADATVRRDAAFVVGTLHDQNAVGLLRDVSRRERDPQVLASLKSAIETLSP
jgi:hypothetical protein